MGSLYNVDGTTGNLTTAGSITSTSTTSGFQLPSMTTTQRNAIVSPTTGLEIFNTTTNQSEFWNGSAWVAVGSGGGSGITALTSDVTATGPGSVAATVNSVGGSSAANIHTAELAANAATALNTSSTIVERDGSGNFAAGTITASLTGHASLDLALTGGTMSGAIDMGTFAITDMADPTNPQDAATKNYVDTHETAPAGSNTQIQYNNSGAFGASSDLTLVFPDSFGPQLLFAANSSAGEVSSEFIIVNNCGTGAIIFPSENFNVSYGAIYAGQVDDQFNNTYSASLALGTGSQSWVFTYDGVFIPPPLTTTQISALGTVANGTVTVVDYTQLSGAILTVGGTALTEGVDWNAVTSNSVTAASIVNALNFHSNNFIGIFKQPPTGQLQVWAQESGISGNSITLATSNPTYLTISGSTLTGGTAIPAEGSLVYNSTSHNLEFYNSTSWSQVFGTIANTSATGQAASITTTTLFTPAATGTYRVSIYIVDTGSDIGYTLQGTIGWTDDAQAQTATTSVLTNISDGYVQSSFFIEATSGNPITYAVALTGTATYNVYAVAERLS